MQNDSIPSEITIIHKTYNFYLNLYHTASTLPKKDRFTIGLKCENLTIELLEEMYNANAKHGDSRLVILRQIDTKLKILQTLIRALFDVKAIDDKKFLQLSELLIEIGKMLGGWIKTTK